MSKYKCLLVVVNEKNIFQGFTILMSGGSELPWELQLQNLHYHENTLRNIWEQLRLVKPPPQNPINSHHKWNEPMTHLSHLGKNQCCTSWYIGWKLGMYNVGMDYQYWRTNQLGMTWATASLIPVPNWAGTWGNTRYIPTLYQCRYQVHTCHIQGTNVCIAICKMCFFFSYATFVKK